MNASVTTTPPGDQIDYDDLFAGLSLSQEARDRAIEIIKKRTRDQNNGELLGTNIGGAGVGFLQILFAFVQNLFAGGNGTSEFNWASLGSQFSNAASGAINSGKQYNINVILTNIYEDFRTDPIVAPYLANNADIITGVSRGTEYARDNRLERQLQKLLDVQPNTTSTLNPPTEVANASGGNGLPPTVTRPLTPRTLNG